MIITIKTSKKKEEYDLNDPAKVKKFKQALAKRARQRGFLTILQDVEKQLTAAQPQPPLPVDNLLADLLAIVREYIRKKAEPVAYTPYPQQLGDVFLPASTRANMPIDIDATTRASALDKYSDYTNPTRLRAYLDSSVTKKRKSAQDNIAELIACFWFDFGRTVGFLNKTHDDYACVLLYITLLKYCFSHNSSAYAAQGYGKTSQQDRESLLYYYRSQDAHPYVRVAHTTRLLYSQASEAKSHDYGLQNSALTTLLVHNLKDGNSYKPAVQAIDANGVLATNHKPEFFGPFLGYIGSRANNVSLLLAALTQPFAKRANQERALTEILPKPKLPAGKLTEKIRQDMTASVLARLLVVKQLLAATQPSIDVHDKLMNARQQQANKIVERTQALTHVKVSHLPAASFVVFEIYPTIDAKLRDSKNFKEGVTNVLIGFLGGLINYNAQARGLHVVLQRRQSFGFLRPTITDVGSLRIRFSLGTEPDSYSDIVIASLVQFDVLLATYNFAASKKNRAPLVTSALGVCEQAKGAKATDKTGNYCLKAMRSERDKWAALVVAQSLLTHNVTQPQPVHAAFEAYINNFVITRVQYEELRSKDNERLSMHGFSFTNTAQIKATAPAQISTDEHVIFAILLNILHYATHYIATLDNSKLPHSYSLYFALQKILHNCQKGVAILAYIDDYEITHLYAKANLLIENLLEYLILLRFLVNPQTMSQENGELIVQQLHDYEQQRMAMLLGLSHDTIDLFFNDSGQQALTASLMALSQQCKADNPQLDIMRIHLFPGSYYELAEFIEKTQLLQQAQAQTATIWVVDIAHIQDLTLALPKLKKNKSQLRTVIIDITNNSSPSTLQDAKTTINELRNQDIWVVLVASGLKHEELGLDKYQTGKSMVLKPQGKTLCPPAKEHLQAISKKAMHPLIASYRQMVETIFNAPITPVASLPQAEAIQKFGVFTLSTKTAATTVKVVDINDQSIIARLTPD